VTQALRDFSDARRGLGFARRPKLVGRAHADPLRRRRRPRPDIASARRLSRAVMRNIRENLFFSFVFNAAGIPIAVGLFYPLFGLLLSPMIAGAAMAVSSVAVIGNSLRLRTLRL
jgi:cation transport ATPase